MAERPEDPETEGPEPTPSGSESVAAAMTAALRRRRKGDKGDPEFDAFLRKQSRLIDLQTEHLHEQRALILSRLRWGRFSDRMKAALQVLTVLTGVAVAGAIAVMAWQAHEDHGVAIAAFSVPPDVAQRGLNGQVVASHLLDRIADLQARTVTMRPASSYANDWGGDIKVEIPETGVSIGDLNRYLRQWLGSETRISGEIVRTPAGVAVTARAGGAPGRRFEGQEADVDTLISHAAEAIYAQTQPYRYAVYLQSAGRIAEAKAQYARLATSGSAEDRPWALTGWASLLESQGDVKDAAEKAEEAIRAAPELEAAYPIAVSAEYVQSHFERTLAVIREATHHLHGREKAQYRDVPLSENLGDFRKAALERSADVSSEGRAGFLPQLVLQTIDFGQAHEVSRARALLSRINPASGGPAMVAPAGAEADCRFAMDDWPGLVAWWGTHHDNASQAAIAYAMTGRLDQAQALVATTPMDCDECLIARAIIAAHAHDWTAADRWFDDVARRAPSSPFPPTEWGRALLAKGDLDGAIAKLKDAHRRGPHDADALELWGEALMQKGESADAVAKFREADQDAPRWGRNHLRWGDVLARLGRVDEARAQWRAAAGMDLSVADRAELTRTQVAGPSAPKQTS